MGNCLTFFRDLFGPRGATTRRVAIQIVFYSAAPTRAIKENLNEEFDTRAYSINDFVEWDKNNQMELNPRFQRRAFRNSLEVDYY